MYLPPPFTHAVPTVRNEVPRLGPSEGSVGMLRCHLTSSPSLVGRCPAFPRCSPCHQTYFCLSLRRLHFLRAARPAGPSLPPLSSHMCFVISEHTAVSGPEEAHHVGLNEGTARTCFTTCEALSHSVCHLSFTIALCGAHGREIGVVGYSRRR